MADTEKEKSSRFDKIRKTVGAIAGPLCAIIIWMMPIENLSEPAHHLLAVMSLIATPLFAVTAIRCTVSPLLYACCIIDSGMETDSSALPLMFMLPLE